MPGEPADPELWIAKHGTNTNPADQNDIKVCGTIDYSYQVTNTGDVTVTTVAVTDATLGSVTCPGLPAQGLAPGSSITCNADNPYTVTQADIDTGGVSDEATATGADANGDSTATFAARADVLAVPAPRVATVKVASVTPAADQDDAHVGDVISYSFLVTNTGNVDLTSISVSDPSLGPVSCPIPAPPASPSESRGRARARSSTPSRPPIRPPGALPTPRPRPAPTPPATPPRRRRLRPRPSPSGTRSCRHHPEEAARRRRRSCRSSSA